LSPRRCKRSRPLGFPGPASAECRSPVRVSLSRFAQCRQRLRAKTRTSARQFIILRSRVQTGSPSTKVKADGSVRSFGCQLLCGLRLWKSRSDRLSARRRLDPQGFGMGWRHAVTKENDLWTKGAWGCEARGMRRDATGCEADGRGAGGNGVGFLQGDVGGGVRSVL